MTHILSIPIAASIVFLLQLLFYGLAGRKYKIPDQYPSAKPRKYPLIVDAKLDKDL